MAYALDKLVLKGDMSPVQLDIAVRHIVRHEKQILENFKEAWGYMCENRPQTHNTRPHLMQKVGYFGFMNTPRGYLIANKRVPLYGSDIDEFDPPKPLDPQTFRVLDTELRNKLRRTTSPTLADTVKPFYKTSSSVHGSRRPIDTMRPMSAKASADALRASVRDMLKEATANTTSPTSTMTQTRSTGASDSLTSAMTVTSFSPKPRQQQQQPQQQQQSAGRLTPGGAAATRPFTAKF